MWSENLAYGHRKVSSQAFLEAFKHNLECKAAKYGNVSYIICK